jgi:hypothetical protein
MSYITLRGRWPDIIVLNGHKPTDVESDGTKDRFEQELNVYWIT